MRSSGNEKLRTLRDMERLSTMHAGMKELKEKMTEVLTSVDHMRAEALTPTAPTVPTENQWMYEEDEAEASGISTSITENTGTEERRDPNTKFQTLTEPTPTDLPTPAAPLVSIKRERTQEEEDQRERAQESTSTETVL